MIAFYWQHLRNVKFKKHLCLHSTWYNTCLLVYGNQIKINKYVPQLIKGYYFEFSAYHNDYTIRRYNIKLLNEFWGTENVSNIRFQQNKPSSHQASQIAMSGIQNL